MNPSDRTAPSQTESILFEFDLHHSPEKVWRALTDPVLLAEWLLPVAGIKLEPGTVFTFKTQPYPGWDGVVNCRIPEIEAPRKRVVVGTGAASGLGDLLAAASACVAATHRSVLVGTALCKQVARPATRRLDDRPEVSQQLKMINVNNSSKRPRRPGMKAQRGNSNRKDLSALESKQLLIALRDRF